MSIFDDEPLPEGTVFYENVILRYDPEARKYLVLGNGKEQWMSREGVEGRHADYLLTGVETRKSQPGNAYNTRFFRRNPDKEEE